MMTKAATVVRFNKQLAEAYGKVCELEQRAKKCSLSDTGNWTNQNVVFTKSLRDMFPVAKTILKGALQRDECRGAHFKPDFAMPGLGCHRPGRASPPGGPVVRSVRRKHAQVAENHGRETLARRRTAAQLRRCRHLAHHAAAPAVRPGRRRHHRASLERTTGRENRPQPAATATASPPGPQRKSPSKARTKSNMHSIISSMSHNDHSITRRFRQRSLARRSRQQPESFEVRVLRQDAPAQASYWQRFRVPYERDMNVISVLQRIAAMAKTIEDRRCRPRGLGLQLPGGSVRRLHDGHQRPRAAGVLGTGGSAAGRQSGRNRTAPAPQSFPVVRDLVVDRSRMFQALKRIKGWIPVDGYYRPRRRPTRFARQCSNRRIRSANA